MPKISIEEMIYECCALAAQTKGLEWTHVMRLLNQKLGALSDEDRKRVLYQLELMFGGIGPFEQRRMH